MSLSTLPTWARGLIATEPVGRLAFLDADDRPRVLPIVYALAGDAVWGVIDTKPKRSAEPARVRWLRRRPEAALCVDVYDDAWERLAWVQLLGSIDLIELDDEPEVLEALRAKYDQYRERTPPGPLLRITVDRALCWRIAEW